jgi:hypothetical protein
MHFKVIGEGLLHVAGIHQMHGDKQRALLHLLEGHLQHT